MPTQTVPRNPSIPTFPVMPLYEDRDTATVPFLAQPLWDFKKGDFAVRGDGSLPDADGWTTWWQWCVKAVATQRFIYDIYTGDYGVDSDGLIGLSQRALAEQMLRREVTDCLRFDSRTDRVEEFVFTWEAATCRVTFVATPVDGPAARLLVVVGN